MFKSGILILVTICEIHCEVYGHTKTHLGDCWVRMVSSNGPNNRESLFCTTFEQHVSKLGLLQPDALL
jgi:hypothetical protein